MKNTAEIMERFNAAFLEHDPTLLEDLVAADCVIENTVPAPDGARYEGRAASPRPLAADRDDAGRLVRSEGVEGLG